MENGRKCLFRIFWNFKIPRDLNKAKYIFKLKGDLETRRNAPRAELHLSVRLASLIRRLAICCAQHVRRAPGRQAQSVQRATHRCWLTRGTSARSKTRSARIVKQRQRASGENSRLPRRSKRPSKRKSLPFPSTEADQRSRDSSDAMLAHFTGRFTG